VSTFTKIESTGQTVQAIFNELARLQAEPPNDAELSKTKSYILGAFPGDRETPQQVAGDLWLIESQGLPADFFEQLLRGVSNTTREECARLAKSGIDPTKMVVVVVGPAAVVKPQLEAIAPVTVVPPDSPLRPLDEEEDDDEVEKK
jgi:predicted Zn-dependent peptidase